MNLLEAILLGVVQGATEFLPISSSGHLKLGQHLLGIQEPQLLFDIVLHVGTLLSVMLFYRADIIMILTGSLDGARGWLKERTASALFAPEGVRLATLVLLATIPTGVIGLVLGKLLDPDSGDSIITPKVVCGLLILNGFILLLNAYFMKREQESEAPERGGMLTLWEITPLIAVGIGVVQGMAVLPGISRSGLTITIALALMVQRLHAARYSFLLSIPAILGALVLKLDPALFAGDPNTLLIFGAGALSAGLVGYGCLILLTRMLEKAAFHHFAWYCWAIGIIGLVML
jgi:undecaprenyl-diphosphatase